MESIKQKPCEHCGKLFTPQRKTAKFGSTKCRVSHSRRNGAKTSCKGYITTPCPDQLQTTAKDGRCRECGKKHRRFKKYPNTPIGAQVISVIRRAKTLETFPSVRSIKEYEEQIKSRSTANGVRGAKVRLVYNVCHKMPVGHPNYVGLSSGENLFVGLSSLNQQAGRELSEYLYDNQNLYIKRSDLRSEYLVNSQTPQSEIMSLLYKRFGETFLNHVVEADHPRKSSAEISEHLDNGGDVADVIGTSLMEHFGDEDYETFSRVFSWAFESSYDFSNVSFQRNGQLLETSFYLPPWEQVQDFLQTGDYFQCDGFAFGIEPDHPSKGEW